jgi:hypothetical protein
MAVEGIAVEGMRWKDMPHAVSIGQRVAIERAEGSYSSL